MKENIMNFLQDQIKQAGFLINRRAEKQVEKALLDAADIRDSDVQIAQVSGQSPANAVVISHGAEGFG